MVSCGPSTQRYNYTHMYSMVDLRSQQIEPCTIANSLYDYISKHPQMKRFRTIIDRANMIGRLSGIQADCTLLIPTDNYLQHIDPDFFNKMDDGLARQILNASTIDRKINRDVITSSPVSYFYTRNPEMRAYVTNISGRTMINNCVSIVKYDIPTINGIIHIVDGLIVPTMDTFMN